MNPVLGAQARDAYLTAAEVVERLDMLAATSPGREGVYRGPRTKDPWDIFPTLEKKEHEASDHAAIYADLTDL